MAVAATSTAFLTGSGAVSVSTPAPVLGASSSSNGPNSAANSSSSSSSANAANMYRIGDYVYFENSSSSCYALRRIEELSKTSSGNVEARVMCFYRRAEIPVTLQAQADRHHWGDSAHVGSNDSNSTHSNEDDSEDEEEKERNAERAAFKLREVFLTRQVETLPATLIRGKCSVTLLSEVETVESYTKRDDAFFYALVYDPTQKTLVADRGEIRIGSAYQATVPPLSKANPKKDGREMEDLEDMLWNPNESKLTTEDIDKFLIIARSVGTFARALDCSSSVKQPSLHMSAAAASRDITLFHAYDLLHKHHYKLDDAIKSLVPGSGPMLCRDEMEDWSASEANLFEEAIEKYGKDFNDIRKDFLPWKSMRNIIEYFFMWKTTDRYVQQKRVKAVESENKLKQVYVPTYTNKTTRLTGPSGEIIIRGKDCDAYPTLAKYSWIQYKKYGKFVPATLTDDSFILDKSSFTNTTPARLALLRPGLIIEPGSPAKASSGKTRAAFFLKTTPITRASRRICMHVARLKHAARKPGKPIDMKALKTETLAKVKSLNPDKIRELNSFTVPRRINMNAVVRKLGLTNQDVQEWLVLTPRSQLPKPAKESFPRPSKRADGSYIYERIPSAADLTRTTQPHQMLYKKRAYDAVDGSSSGGHSHFAKIQRTAPPNQVPGKSRIATLTRVQGGQRQVISWMDAPDDVFYKATAVTKRMRKKFSTLTLRRAARKPFKRCLANML